MNRNFPNGGKQYSMRVSPVRLDCSFTVDSSQPSGISNLNGPAIQAIYMHSVAATPSSPNPDAGNIVIRLQDNCNALLSVDHKLTADLSGSDLTSVTAGSAYVIILPGTTTAAQFQAKGLSRGITPAAGVAFIATASGALGGTGTVQIAAATGSGIANMEILGSPSMSPDPRAQQGFGAQIIMQCRDYAGALANPADGSVVHLEIYMNNSSVVTG